jgi:hypothetical protein
MKIFKIAIFAAICFAFIYLGFRIYEITHGLSISDQGSTGDAFNGFVSPFIALIAAVLVYLAFNEQVKANILLSSSNQLETFTKLLAQIKTQVDEFEFTDTYPTHKANSQIKDLYLLKDNLYFKKFNGAPAMYAFANNLKRNAGEISWKQKEHIKALLLIYEDVILLHGFIENTRGENSKYYYIKLNFYFELAFAPSFILIYNELYNKNSEFYYKTIHSMHRVAFVLSGYQYLEQISFKDSMYKDSIFKE